MDPTDWQGPTVYQFGQGFKKNRTGRLVMRRSGEEVYGWISWNGYHAKIFTAQLNGQHRASIAEEALD